MKIKLTKEIMIPDPVKVARYERVPELGPKILFFSGGTALKKLSRHIIKFTHNSIHIITPFDSGGSSAKLRHAFNMPAIGDVRNRMMALSDQSIQGNPEIYELFAHRLSKTATQTELRAQLEDMDAGKHPLVKKIPNPMRKIIRHHLCVFRESMPKDFDLRGASIGNLVIAAGYLENRGHLDPVIYIFSKLARVLGTVRPVIGGNYHLCTELEDGTLLVGQHLIAGKEAPDIQSKIKRVYISEDADGETEAKAPIRNKMKELITKADLICYPLGSFYSSIIANLLPSGVGRAVSANSCPKVFIPNTGTDPECFSLGIQEQVDRLLKTLMRDSKSIKPKDVLNLIIMDKDLKNYSGKLDAKELKELGIEVIREKLVSGENGPLLDEKLLAPVLLSLT